jgi:hypothetical protein
MKNKYLTTAADSKSNLNVFYALIAILEGGCILGESANKAAAQIIKICKAEAHRQLGVYDVAVAMLESKIKD